MADPLTHASLDQPSRWVERFAALIPPGEVLDLACGSGRHARLLAARGHPVMALDRDPDALERTGGTGIRTLRYDLEQDAPWPFESNRFAGIVVTNYLHRPLLPRLFEGLVPGGVLIYETFAVGNERFGKPSRPDFLLRPGELFEGARLHATSGVRVIAFEDGYVEHPKPAMVQRICARRATLELEPMRLALDRGSAKE